MLSNLEKVELREVWKSESSDFTPWLAKEENLKILSDAIGYDLTLDEQEKSVGPFKADIVCDDAEGSKVLIENQLERTDHKHLGQLMTYASGLDAVTIIWVAAEFTDEHRAAINWLNEITKDSFRFFGLEIELWRIGESPIAPKFNIIAKPNDWRRSLKAIASGEISDTKQLYLEYWQALKDKVAATNTHLKIQGPRPQHWANIGIGKSGYKLSALASTQYKWIAINLHISDDPNAICIRQLMDEQEEIEKIIGSDVEWREMLGNKTSQVLLKREEVDPSNKGAWGSQMDWLSENLIKFDKAFRERIRNIDPNDDSYADDQNGDD